MPRCAKDWFDYDSIDYRRSNGQLRVVKQWHDTSRDADVTEYEDGSEDVVTRQSQLQSAPAGQYVPSQQVLAQRASGLQNALSSGITTITIGGNHTIWPSGITTGWGRQLGYPPPIQSGKGGGCDGCDPLERTPDWLEDLKLCPTCDGAIVAQHPPTATPNYPGQVWWVSTAPRKTRRQIEELRVRQGMIP